MDQMLERLNKMILLVSLCEALITKPDDIPTRDFFWNEVKIADTLPKDELLELQQLQQEMTMGLESRRNAMKRMGKENIDELTAEIDEDMKKNPCIYGHLDPNDPMHMAQNAQINSGMLNGQTTVEQVRTEMTGQNGGAEI